MESIDFNLTVEKANLIIKALAELPFKDSANLIIELQTQYKNQAKPTVEKVE